MGELTDRATDAVYLPHPNSGLPEFGTLRWPKSDISDLGWGRSASKASRVGAKISRLDRPPPHRPSLRSGRSASPLQGEGLPRVAAPFSLCYSNPQAPR